MPSLERFWRAAIVETSLYTWNKSFNVTGFIKICNGFCFLLPKEKQYPKNLEQVNSSRDKELYSSCSRKFRMERMSTFLETL